ncbi:MAG: DNA-binding protein [Comamonadaceae bacterium]|nr:MAG: DNA-binding protein [Comamonadaceae bacterium]
MKPVLRTHDVAELLQCSEEQVELLARGGILPGLKPGRAWVFPCDALLLALGQKALQDALLRRGEAPAPAPATQPTPPKPMLPPSEPAGSHASGRRRSGPPPALSMPPSVQACG